MYTRCIWCTAPLGRNETLEHFPVGRRIAFDADKGRLWVVCARCERWNLTPLEERWEAIEHAERRFRDTRTRVTSGEIGLARVDDGLELVRIGAPLRPEFAAWRYGDQFGRRWKRTVALGAMGATAVGGYLVAGPVMGWIAGGGLGLLNVPALLERLDGERLAAVVTDDAGTAYQVKRRQLSFLRLVAGKSGEWKLLATHTNAPAKSWAERVATAFDADFHEPALHLSGEAALRAAATLLPKINARGGTRRTITDAVEVLDTHADINTLFAYAATANPGRYWGRNTDGVAALPSALRLALEMATHEGEEREAADGELTALVSRWKEAEEIAAIADDMFIPAATNAKLRALHDAAGKSPNDR